MSLSPRVSTPAQPVARLSPPFLGPSSPPTRRRSGWLGGSSVPPTDHHAPAPFPLSPAHPRPPNHPQPQHSAQDHCPSSPVHQSCVRASCVRPSHHNTSFDTFTFMIHAQTAPVPAFHSPVPHTKSPPQAHFVRRVIRFPSFRFARTLPSSPACIHRIPFSFSLNPEPQAPARCACRGGCDRMIAFSTVCQLMTTS